MNPDAIFTIFVQIVVFLFAISVHESAHAWTASRYGDPTARMLGRVSLNPIRHIDPIGTVLLPAIALFYHIPMIGWAKPTPVNPRNFGSRYVFADIMTSVAGPVSNFLVAGGAVIGLVLISWTSAEGRNIIRHGMESNSPLAPLSALLLTAMQINVLLAVFNLIPIPPLDGSHVLRHFLSDSVRSIYDRLGWAALVLFFLIGGRVLGALVTPFLEFFYYVLMRLA